MIRSAQPKDASRLAEILIFTKRMSYRSIFHNDIVTFQKMQVLDLALKFRDQPSSLKNLYVYDDGIVKGLIRWEMVKSGFIEIEELYVDAFFHGEGVGHELLDSCIAAAEDLEAHTIMLWVLEENLSARRFYEHYGFHADSQKKLYPGTNAVLCRYIFHL